MRKFKIEIITLEGKVFSDEIESLILPTPLGEIGVLAGHIPLVTTLEAGEIRVRKEGEIRYLACSGGFAKIHPNKTIVLADAAEHSEEIDIKRAEEAKRRAEETMKKAGLPKTEYAIAAAALRRSLVRLKVARKRRKTKRVSHFETET